MLTRCNQCGKLFKDDNGLIKVVEVFDSAGLSYYLYNPTEPIDDYFEQVIDACPNCMTDEYLMDLGDIGLHEVSEELNYRENASGESRWNDALAHISTDELEVMETILEQE
jgi:predicted  nucleic acid-binding Zn-ribbon protein